MEIEIRKQKSSMLILGAFGVIVWIVFTVITGIFGLVYTTKAIVGDWAMDLIIGASCLIMAGTSGLSMWLLHDKYQAQKKWEEQQLRNLKE